MKQTHVFKGKGPSTDYRTCGFPFSQSTERTLFFILRLCYDIKGSCQSFLILVMTEEVKNVGVIQSALMEYWEMIGRFFKIVDNDFGLHERNPKNWDDTQAG